MSSQRKTIDVWYIFVNYGSGFGSKDDAECVEFGRYQFLNNWKAYLQNCPYPIKTSKGRILKSTLPESLDEKSIAIAEAKAEIEYRTNLIREKGDSTHHQHRIERARKKLATIN